VRGGGVGIWLKDLGGTPYAVILEQKGYVLCGGIGENSFSGKGLVV
jgi:uncharacterized protein YunC (DUF1805 family)